MILLGITGSVAAILAPQLIRSLQSLGPIEVILTRSAHYFVHPSDLNVPFWTDADEWKKEFYTRSDPILHIELRRRADALVIAPCTAETLSALANGRAYSLLTTVARAWDLEKPVILAPAMNTFMWRHPATAEHLHTLQRWYGERLHVVQPVEKTLACGDQGIGALAPVNTIQLAVKKALSS
ncbi:MAG TPA: flavoprotein [Patescibacteria group bacterium]|nr:flavoprotein [Patescibacteria group bacterium]